MTRTHPERAVPLNARKPRVTRPGAGPPRVPAPGVLSPERMGELQDLADQFAEQYGDTPEVTEARVRALADAVEASPGEVESLVRKARHRAELAWSTAIGEAITNLTIPVANAA